MKRKVFLTFLVLLFAQAAFAADSSLGAENAAYFGIWTVLPPLIAIGLAFISKNVILSLFFGTFAGCFMATLRTGSIFEAFIGGFMRIPSEALTAISDVWNAGIVLQVLMIGGLVALVTRMGGLYAVAEAITRLAKGPKSTQMATWLMGLFIFFDDYANALIVGPMMRPATDKMQISRERLLFIIDGTAAPVAGMVLISTWIAYEVGVINDALGIIGSEANAYGIFISSLPSRFYNIFILFFIVATALMLREFGPMYKAEKRARLTGKVIRDASMPAETDTMAPMPLQTVSKSSVWYAIIPIGTLIVSAFIGFYLNGYNNILAGGDASTLAAFDNGRFSFEAIQAAFSASDASIVLFQAALIATIVAILMGIIKKIFTIGEALDTTLTGIKSMNITAVILLFAWSLSAIIQELGTATYLVDHLSGSIPYWGLPAIIFVLGSIISFASGTSYGTMGILMPLAIPLAWAIVPEQDYIILNVSAVLTGAIFGDHCSPISDTTILSSMGASVDLMDHVTTQMPYALSVAAISVVIYIFAGLGLNVWVAMLLGCIITALMVRFVGKRVPDAVAQG